VPRRHPPARPGVGRRPLPRAVPPVRRRARAGRPARRPCRR
jgi:hypothetical protein